MAFRRKRRFRGTWFPPIGSFLQGTSGNDAPVVPTGFSLTSTSAVTGEYPVLIFPVITDAPQLNDTTPSDDISLVTQVGSEYALRRIVGKVHIRRVPLGGVDPDNGVALLVAAGFFVARAQGNEGDKHVPVGAGTITDFFGQSRRDNFSPLDIGTLTLPWIWRRTWVLGNAWDPTAAAVARGDTAFYQSNGAAASALDGAHFDAKTRRRVTQEERLFFTVAFCPFDDQTSIEGEEIQGRLDVRVFGALRRARNHGSL
jgi:hypothetical protein